MSTTETTRCVVKENARPRDPRLEQEPTDTVAMASTRTTGHANFGSNSVVSDDGGVNTHSRAHTPPPRQFHHTSKRSDWSRADKGQG